MKIRNGAALAAAVLSVGLAARAWRAAEARPVGRLTGAATPPAPRLAIARLQYDGGGDWYANPSSLPNLIKAIRERTSFAIDPNEGRVTLMDERLWEYPFIHMTGHGNVTFSDAEAVRLREYLARGGFLHVDDNYGLDESIRREMKKVFPDRELVDVPLSHPIYHVVYDFPKGVPKIHEHDAKPARGFGIFLGDRLAVYYTWESDLGNGWEDVGTYPSDPPELHEQALRMGVNLFTYAVTSRPTP
ncbi:MAG: DUF4159 domain-containing protein [Gemmatimonadaceae bacterium]|nr:DUF4159 domain-containing protein [Gemmatimonadaceae bacterium]